MKNLLRTICPACRSSHTALFRKRTAAGAMRLCRDCKTLFAQEPRMDEVIVARDDACACEAVVSDAYYLHELRGRRAEARRRLRLLKKICQKCGISRRGRLLEIGSYIGIFLHEAKCAGWEVAGVEPVSVAATWAREKLHVPVREGVLKDARFPHQYFDVVVMYQVLEHILDDAAVLKEIYRVLKPGGILVMETPNAASWPVRLFGKAWRGFIPGHITLYSPRGLCDFLERLGFQTVFSRSWSGKRISMGLIAQEIKDILWPAFGSILAVFFRITFLDRVILFLWLPDNMTIASQKPYAHHPSK